MGKRVTILCLGALLAALGVLAAGCGGSSSATTVTVTTASSTTSANTQAGGRFGAGFQAFQTCLKNAGITVPQFTRRPPAGTTQTTTTPTTTTRRRGGFFGAQRNLTPAQQKAFQTCRSKLPQGGFGFGGRNGGGNGGPPPQGGFTGGAFAKYTSCLKKHGVTFGKSSSGTAFRKAQTACRSLLPSRPTQTTPTLEPATTTVSS